MCSSLAFSASIDDNLLSDILDKSEIEVDQLQAKQRVSVSQQNISDM